MSVKRLTPVWLVGTFCGLVISAGAAIAQDYPQPTLPQGFRPSTAMSRTPRYIAPGYVPDMNFYWAPSGRHPEVLRPLPPGVISTPDGILFEPLPKQARAYSYYRTRGHLGWFP